MALAAEGDSALDRCVTSLVEENLTEARPLCVEAAGQSREDVLCYSDLLEVEVI